MWSRHRAEWKLRMYSSFSSESRNPTCSLQMNVSHLHRNLLVHSLRTRDSWYLWLTQISIFGCQVQKYAFLASSTSESLEPKIWKLPLSTGGDITSMWMCLVMKQPQDHRPASVFVSFSCWGEKYLSSCKLPAIILSHCSKLHPLKSHGTNFIFPPPYDSPSNVWKCL